MIKVLVDGIAYGTQQIGGISRCFTETLSRIGHKNNDIKVILHLPRRPPAMVIPSAEWIQRINDVDLKATRLQKMAGALSKARIRMLRPHIFHSTYYARPYWSGLRSVVTVYDFIHEQYPTLLGDVPMISAQKRVAIESADAIIAISTSTKEGILRHTRADEGKITVVHPSVNDVFLTPVPSAEGVEECLARHNIGRPYWLYVGTRWSYKNFATLLRAFIRIASQTDGYLVTVGGEVALEPWQFDVVIRNRLEHRMRLLRGIDDLELKILYSGAAAFVLPSLMEGFGIPLLEAMACGTPIIASDIPVFREVAADAAVYFDPHDGEALADAMLGILEEDVRQPLIGIGHRRVQRFSWDTAAQQMSGIYRSLI